MMNKIEATFQIVTPMFIGGADQKQSDGVRPPSVKGALRFWWRALNWGKIFEQEKDETKALKALHAEEARLFGFAADTGGGGQGEFLLMVKNIESTSPEQQMDIGSFTGKAYLAGMGLAKREALPFGKHFVITLILRRRMEQTTIDQLQETLRVFGLMGGLGSRNRHGFGSISVLIKDGDEWRLPTEVEIKNDREWLKTKLSGDIPTPFSALSSSSLFYHGKNYNSAEEALEKVGSLMNRYRTNGTSIIKKNGRIIKAASKGYRIVSMRQVHESTLKFYKTDHHHVHAIAKTEEVSAPHNVPPKRSIFGLPHSYRFSSLNGKKVSFDYKPGKEKCRRASPLLIHIAAFTSMHGGISYCPQFLLIPARFLPQGACLKVSVGQHSTVPAPDDYSPITDFLSAEFTKC